MLPVFFRRLNQNPSICLIGIHMKHTTPAARVSDLADNGAERVSSVEQHGIEIEAVGFEDGAHLEHHLAGIAFRYVVEGEQSFDVGAVDSLQRLLDVPRHHTRILRPHSARRMVLRSSASNAPIGFYMSIHSLSHRRRCGENKMTGEPHLTLQTSIPLRVLYCLRCSIRAESPLTRDMLENATSLAIDALNGASLEELHNDIESLVTVCRMQEGRQSGYTPNRLATDLEALIISTAQPLDQ